MRLKSSTTLWSVVANFIILVTYANGIEEKNSYVSDPALNDLGDGDLKLPKEIQTAVCTVTAGEVKASAEAVTTKTLKGVCGSDEMKTHFQNLEDKLFLELENIKLLLENLVQAQGLQGCNKMEVGLQENKIKDKTLFETFPKKPEKDNVLKFEHISNEKTKMAPKLKMLYSKHSVPVEREQEVKRFNNTMLADQEFKLFTYYWKLENVSQHISNNTPTTVSSPTFSIKAGKMLQLKCSFHHLYHDLLYLQLNSAMNKEITHNNIALDMGGLFKQITVSEQMPFFKHKISILDQNSNRLQDLCSQELVNLDSGFSIPNSAVLDSPYIKNNTILIQVILYL